MPDVEVVRNFMNWSWVWSEIFGAETIIRPVINSGTPSTLSSTLWDGNRSLYCTDFTHSLPSSYQEIEQNQLPFRKEANTWVTEPSVWWGLYYSEKMKSQTQSTTSEQSHRRNSGRDYPDTQSTVLLGRAKERFNVIRGRRSRVSFKQKTVSVSRFLVSDLTYATIHLRSEVSSRGQTKSSATL